MKNLFLLITTLSLAVLAVTNVSADDRKYTLGTVWEVTYVRTESGHFDHYVENLASNWRKYMDAEIKEGTIVSYKVISSQLSNQDDWDLMLLIERPNFAAYDRGLEYYDSIAKTVLNQTAEEGAKAYKDRGKIRTILGNKLGQEVVFK